MSLSGSTQKVIILGDSTIDNRIWLGPEVYQLVLNRLLPSAGLFQFLRRYNPFRPKSVVENLRAQLPNATFIDRTNDGFTTQDVLYGAYKDKVFGVGAHDLFPHEFFQPLHSEDCKDATHIILSVGGNNFREFIQQAMGYSAQERNRFIQSQYPIVFENLLADYKAILKELCQNNPNAQIILMTQYYPATQQKMLINHNIYDFMQELGQILKTGDAKDTIVKVMEDTYNQVLHFMATDSDLQKRNISIVDVTSSLNPNCSQYFTGQIEPNDLGGQRIAKMLAYVLNNPAHPNKRIFRFLPAFFESKAPAANNVLSYEVDSDSEFSPIHPNKMYQPNASRLRKYSTPIVGIMGFLGLFAFAGYGIMISSIVAVSGMWLSSRVNRYLNQEPLLVDEAVDQLAAKTQLVDESALAVDGGPSIMTQFKQGATLPIQSTPNVVEGAHQKLHPLNKR